jgi:hypothetical protein
MTLLGKILVFVNLALSLCMATWAYAVWSNRIDFSNTKATGDQAAGEFARHATEIEGLWDGVPPAELAWRSARAELVQRESRRLADRGWYQDELNHLRNKAAAADPCRTIKYADKNDEATGTRKGEILLDPTTGRPVLEPAKDRFGKPLLSLAAYLAEEQKLLASLAVVQNKHASQIKEATELAERLAGTEENREKGIPGRKGLQDRLRDEQRKRKDVVAEEELIRPLLINSAVESELILKRKKALESRIGELKGAGVALGQR